MATRKNQPLPATPPSVSPEVGITLINRLITKGEEILASRPVERTDCNTWENMARDYLTRAFGSDSDHMYTVLNAGNSGFSSGQSEAYYENKRATDLSNQIKAAKGLIEILETDIELNSSSVDLKKKEVQNEDIFIVHGHNDGIKQTVARLLEKLGLKVTILHELPNEGRTVIEKLVDSSDVGFAVILLTADDRGGVKSAPFKDQKPRARQNVILELGYFLAKLKRHQVCAIYEEGVEIPSDYQGVLFIPYDAAGLWKYKLAKELQAAKIPVDLNKID